MNDDAKQRAARIMQVMRDGVGPARPISALPVAPSQVFTAAEAADETLLLLTRKLRRLHPEAFRGIWDALPDGAQRAIYAAENRADQVRARGGKTWEPVEELDSCDCDDTAQVMWPHPIH